MKRRIFLGIPVPEKIKKDLVSGLSYLREIYPTYRFVESENYHVTVSFFGEIEEERIPDLLEVLEKVTKNYPSFSLQSKEIITAPAKNPRMLWASCSENIEFNTLVGTVEREVCKLTPLPDYRKGQNPHPHITLAKYKSKGAQINTFPKLNISFDVKGLSLFESKPKGNISRYIPIAEFSLMDL